MATLATLADRGSLVRVDVPLDPGELQMRLFYGRPPFIHWLVQRLPSEPADRGGRQSPAEQVDDLLHRFITGRPLANERDLHPLRPTAHCVWELKTIDVRIFGWFPNRDVFVAVNGAMAKLVKDMGIYGGFRNEVCTFRDRLDLDEPKCLQGSMVSDVLFV
jgi:hypothetical protein